MDQKQFAVVTGASSGIGRELAKIFAKNGYDLLLCSETEEIEEAAREISASGANVEPFQADLATAEGVEALYEKIGHRPVDAIALNSAGFNLARVIGPSVAAIVIGTLGAAWCFALNSMSYLAVLAGLFMIRVPKWQRVDTGMQAVKTFVVRRQHQHVIRHAQLEFVQ